MLSIRKATKQDAKVAWEIRNAAILDQCIGYYHIEILDIWASGELSEDFANTVAKHFYVAIDGYQVVGTGMLNIETGKLDAIFVHPDHMRKGIGKKIVYHLERIAMRHGLEALSLESTLNAASFYRACGFEGNEVGKYDSPRGIALECIPMVKTISLNDSLQPQ